MKGLLFTYALTYGGALMSFLNPFYGLLVYICFAIIKPESLWHWSVPAGNYSRIVAIALLAGWAMHGFGDRRLGRGGLPIFCLASFWGWAVFSGAFASDPDTTIGFLEASGKIILPVVVGATLIQSTQQLTQLAWTIVLSLGYVAFDLNASYLAGFNRLHGYGFGGMDNNSFAIGLVTGICLAFYLGLATRWLPGKLLAFALAASISHAVCFSFSRGAMLAMLCSGFVAIFYLPRTKEARVWLIIGIILAGVMAGPSVWKRFSTVFVDQEERDYSSQSRVDLWSICIQIAAESPVVGVGPNHFPLVVEHYQAPSGERFPAGKEAHSLWFQQLAEMGVPGLAFIVGYYGLTMLRLHSQKRWFLAEDDPFLCCLPGMVVPSLAGFIVAAQFVSLEGLEIPYYVALVGVGALRLQDELDFDSAELGAYDRFAVA